MALVLLYTVLMIGGLTVVIVMAVMIYQAGRFPATEIMGFVVGLVTAVISLVQIVKLNRREVNRRIDETVNQRHDYVQQWTIGTSQWRRFIESKRLEDMSKAKEQGYTVGFALMLIAAIPTLIGLDWVTALLIILGCGLLGFVLGALGTLGSAKRTYRNQSSFDQGEIHFARDLIVFNGTLIQFNDFGFRLVSIEFANRYSMKSLAVKVQMGWGNRKSVTEYWLPVPDDKIEEAGKLKELYETLISKV